MALLNHAKKELSAKIVYYGPGLSGKTTNLEWIHRKLAPDKRGKLISLETKTDRTLFFDFLPVQIGEISGFRTRFNVYTVPGQIFYNETRRMVLKGVDGIVFVADSQKEMANENLENLKNLAENLRSIGKELSKVPLVIQFNKRDLPNILSVEEMNRLLNAPGLPFFEAVAVKGEGVLTTLTRITRVVADHLKETLFATPGAEAPAGRPEHAPTPVTRNEPPRAFPDAPAQPVESETPAFLSNQPQAAPPSGIPEPQVFAQHQGDSPSFAESVGEPHRTDAPQPGLAAVGAAAPQPAPSDDIPSLGDPGDAPEAKPDLGAVPTLASLETTPGTEMAAPTETVASMDRSAPADRVIPLERPAPVEAVPAPPSPAPVAQTAASSDAQAGSYWVDPSLVSVAAENVSAPESSQGVALRFGEPERESGNQVRIPVALRLEATNELVSFQMVLRLEQPSEE
jgi:signal recognition particle receptor subunit beta